MAIVAPSATLAANTAKTVATAAVETRQEERMVNLKARADKEIDRRLTALNAIKTKINAIKRLTTDQKSAMTTAIDQNITDLTALKTKINADTDPTTLQADVKSIVDSYRVYALFIPKIHILTAGDAITDLLTKLNALETKLETRIAEAKTAGNDVAALETALAEMKTKLADAKTQSDNAVSTVTSLEPAGYPGNKGSLQTALGLLKTARADIVTAKQDAKTIVNGLKAIKTPTPTASTAEPETSPAPVGE